MKSLLGSELNLIIICKKPCIYLRKSFSNHSNRFAGQMFKSLLTALLVSSSV